MSVLMAIDPNALGLEVTGMSGSEAHCRCPFHDDSSQSASFNVLKGSFYCFVCHEGKSAHTVAKALGSTIVRVPFDRLDFPRGKKSEIDWSWVLSAEPAIHNKYLTSRGVRPHQIKEFDIRQYSSGVLFPLKTRSGAVVGAIARLYTGAVRYIYYGERTPLFPMDRLGESKDVVLVEGVFGVLRARRYGIPAYAILSSENAQRITRFIAGFRRKVCIFDNDKAGQHAAYTILNAGIGAEAYYPGAEADEEGKEFWHALQHSERLTYDSNQFV